MKQNRISSLFKHSAIYALATYLQRFLSFLMMPFYTRTAYIATLQEFGDYVLLYTFIAFMNFFFVLGQDVAYLRYKHESDTDQNDVFKTSLVNILWLSLLFSLIILFFRDSITSVLGISRPEFLYFAVGIIALDSFSNPFYTRLRADEHSVTFSIIKITRFFMELFFNILFVVVLKYGIWGILIANGVAAFFNLLILLIANKNQLKGHFNKRMALELLKFGIPFVPAGVAFVAIEQVDKILVNHYLSKEMVSIYGASYKFGTILLFLVIAFRNAWQPYFLRVAKQEKNAKEIFARINNLIFSGMTVIWLILGLFLGDLLIIELPVIGRILGNSAYWEGVIIIPIVLLSYVYYALYVGFTPGFYILKKGSYLALFTFAGFLTNFVINSLFLESYGYLVAAWATVAAYVVMTSGIIIVNQLIYPLPVNWNKIFLLTGIHGLTLFILLETHPGAGLRFLFIILFICIIFYSEKENLKVFFKKKAF
ncbi:MAG: lipopolysaccharide biosynthesis protein [Calditrichia bacterium]